MEAKLTPISATHPTPNAGPDAPDNTMIELRSRESSGDSITVLFTWDVQPGQEAAFEQWAHRMTTAASQAEGHRGATWLRPAPGRSEYVTIVHFRDNATFQAWRASATRAALVEEAQAFTTERSAQATGVEPWFTLPGKRALSAPPKWKMFLVTCLGVYPLSLLFALTLLPWMAHVPLALRTVVTTALLAGLLTWLVMPRLTQWLRAWLYPAPKLPA